MQKEKKESGAETDQTQEVKEPKVVDFIPIVNEVDLSATMEKPTRTMAEIKAEEDQELIQKQIEKAEQQQKGFALRIPDWKNIAGSGRVILQMERFARFKELSSGLILPGNASIGQDLAEKYKSPIPSDAVWFVVGYDPDINMKYREEKLRLLGLHEQNGKHRQQIREMEDKGELDVIRIGDQIVMNNETFIPVRIKEDFDIMFVAHMLDCMGIYKCFPRNKFESQNPALK